MRYLRALAFSVSTVVMYLGFTLLGWGLLDLRGYFSLAARAGYAVVVVAFGLAVGYQGIGGLEGIRGGRGEEGKLVPRQHIVRVLGVLSLYAALILLPFADRRAIAVIAVGQAVRWLGVALCALGYGLIFWSGVALGRQYSAEVTIQKDHRLITVGLYRYIRHPRYLGAICAACGLGLLFRSWIGLAAALLLVGVLLARIRDEEALLRQEFGPDWEAYCRRSWRLIPYLY